MSAATIFSDFLCGNLPLETDFKTNNCIKCNEAIRNVISEKFNSNLIKKRVTAVSKILIMLRIAKDVEYPSNI
jgi:hypothetical protein